MSNINLFIVGSVGIDDITTREQTQTNLLGGSVSYGCAAASFFTKVGAVGVVGSDFPPEFLKCYSRFGIDTAGIQTKPGQTFRWAGAYNENMIDRTTLNTELGVFAEFEPELPPAYRSVKYILLGNIQPTLQLHVLDQVESPDFVAMDTMNLWINIARDELLKVISRVDMISLNDEEARLLTGCYQMRDCAEAILNMGPRYVAIKKGEHGSLLFSRGGIFIVPAYPVYTLVDPTGAGDMYAGAFMGRLASRGRTDEAALRDALVYGSVISSFGVEAFSTDRLMTLTQADITARYAELITMITP